MRARCRMRTFMGQGFETQKSGDLVSASVWLRRGLQAPLVGRERTPRKSETRQELHHAGVCESGKKRPQT
jgi:hypothetical protein